MKKRCNSKFALKLINKYAEQYYRIAKENKELQTQLIDLQGNIKLNKDNIETFLSNSSNDIKTNELLLHYKKENNSFITQVNRYSKENFSLREKIMYYEEIINKSITDNRVSIETLNTRIFILENIIKKKDSIIRSLKEKEENKQEGNNNFFEFNRLSEYDVIQPLKQEIYVIDPTESVKIIHDDLNLYKQAFDKALKKIKETHHAIEKYEVKIEELKRENNKLQNIPFSSPSYYTNANTNTNIKSNLDVVIDESSKINLEHIISSTKLSKIELEIVSQTNIGLRVLTLINQVLGEKNAQIISLEKEILMLKNNNKNLMKKKIRLVPKSEYEINKCFRKNEEVLHSDYINTNISMMGNNSRDENCEKKNYNDIYNDNINNFERLNQSAGELYEVTTEIKEDFYNKKT